MGNDGNAERTDLTDEVASLQHEVEALEHELEEGKVAHPIELFFDLVYVFAFTRVVSLIVKNHDLEAVLQGALVMALLWWSWGTWTWTMNLVDLTDRFRRVVILVSMFGIFLMGYAIPTTFKDDAMWFAVGYVFTRVLAGVVAWFGTAGDTVEHDAMRQFLPYSAIAPVLVIGGAAIGGDALPWIWLAAAAVEVTSALLSGRSEWHVDAGHFAERHGLIMIIALGEAIIAVGVALTAAAGDDAGVSGDLAWRLGVGLAGVCAMWWAYFDKLQGIWETALEQASRAATGAVARDVYSLGHYPMITGIVFFAVGLEEAFLHPVDPPTTFTRWILGAGVALYFGAQTAVQWRAWRIWMYERLIGVTVIVGFLVVADMKAELVVLIVTAIMLVTMAAEYWRFRDEVRNNPALRR